MLRFLHDLFRRLSASPAPATERRADPLGRHDDAVAEIARKMTLAARKVRSGRGWDVDDTP